MSKPRPEVLAAEEQLLAAVAGRPAGWTVPGGREHWHAFAGGHALSVCGRVLAFGPLVRRPGAGRVCGLCRRESQEGTQP